MPSKYLDMEIHYYAERTYLLNVVERNVATRIELKHETILLLIRPGSDIKTRAEAMNLWYRE